MDVESAPPPNEVWFWFVCVCVIDKGEASTSGIHAQFRTFKFHSSGNGEQGNDTKDRITIMMFIVGEHWPWCLLQGLTVPSVLVQANRVELKHYVNE